MKSLKRFCEGGWERRGGCVCMWLQGNPRPFFDGLKEQQISGAESSKSWTWYLKARSGAADSTISTDKWRVKVFDPIDSLDGRRKSLLDCR